MSQGQRNRGVAVRNRSPNRMILYRLRRRSSARRLSDIIATCT